MLDRLTGLRAGRAAWCGVRRGVALVVLATLTLALAGPLVGSGLGGDPTYCCRKGRCCCDSGEESADSPDLKAACGCARPGQEAAAFGIPLGLVVTETAVSSPAPAALLEPGRAPSPRHEATEPLEHPPPHAALHS